MKSYTTQAQPHNPRKTASIYLDAETEQIVNELVKEQRISFSNAIRRIIHEWDTSRNNANSPRERGA